MAKYAPFYRRPASAAAVVLLIIGILAIVLVRAYGPSHRQAQTKYRINAETLAIDIMRQMHAQDEGETLPPDLTLAELMSDENWDAYGFEAKEVELEMKGITPEYAGTTITISSDRLHGPLTVTVLDLSQEKWETESEPVPAWWEVWR